ncbi:hypothetical protein F8G81_21205 [Arthrobacter sp. CDRTa11]|uniref:hypothetical protein n=1 Tax=Arthrobacter sp. CDRTa11 TaxID=2651199 RepID=UPI002265E81D|nr:hypothetical protein [Arthrobacter sp. CDRTa11]UZX04827.1 hypothetical protein F8G81_21205 [Arthrobacter sp. CDRTa11]
MTTSSEEPQNSADLRGPGDPDHAAEPKGGQQPKPEAGTATNIREEQQTQAPGTVPASYVGSGGQAGQTAEPKPEEAADESGMWDDQA